MEITEQRAIAVTKLGGLQKIRPKVYTALELRPKRQMLALVQRQAQRRYLQEVQKRKVKLKKDISDIDKYLASVEEYDAYVTGMSKGQRKKAMLTSPVAPAIVFGKKPMLKQTRFKRHKRRGRF